METLTVILLVATPVLAFLGAMAGHLLLRRTAVELDRWRKREETMRLMRWAVELATDTDQDRARAGLIVLGALLDSPLLDEADIDLVATVAGVVALPPTGSPASTTSASDPSALPDGFNTGPDADDDSTAS